MWNPSGVLIYNATNIRYHSKITSDGSGGANISWWDNRRYYFQVMAFNENGNSLSNEISVFVKLSESDESISCYCLLELARISIVAAIIIKKSPKIDFFLNLFLIFKCI
ncbi:MAG: hypothetical protein JW891_11540 [Candidatus Lokiarchaeota archaeon]|nr:hypothetical protein [Candidatus Lokiarchaeota archaeon]